MKHPVFKGIFHKRSFSNYFGVLKRGEAPLKKYLPLPLDKGKRIQEIGLLNNL